MIGAGSVALKKESKYSESHRKQPDLNNEKASAAADLHPLRWLRDRAGQLFYSGGNGQRLSCWKYCA